MLGGSQMSSGRFLSEQYLSPCCIELKEQKLDILKNSGNQTQQSTLKKYNCFANAQCNFKQS